jgi:hypothetical protein
MRYINIDIIFTSQSEGIRLKTKKMDMFTAVVTQTDNRTFFVIYPTTLFSIMQKIGQLEANSILKIEITVA